MYVLKEKRIATCLECGKMDVNLKSQVIFLAVFALDTKYE